MKPLVPLRLVVIDSPALQVHDAALSIELWMRVRDSTIEYVGNVLGDEAPDMLSSRHRASNCDPLRDPLMVMN